METVFTPFASFGRGLAIGLSAVLLMLGLGRILGATGIMSGLVFAENRSEFGWRAAMVLGMILAPGLIFAVTGTMPEVNMPVSPAMIAIGGVIVGLGASLGSGCTSGHGVCGLSRLSIRSLVAVPTFIATAAIPALGTGRWEVALFLVSVAVGFYFRRLLAPIQLTRAA